HFSQVRRRCHYVARARKYYPCKGQIFWRRSAITISSRPAVMPTMEASPHRIIIEAGRGEKQYWHDLWRYRELLYFLAWRDIMVRYKQTVVGVAWSLIRPLLTMIVFTLIFGKLAKMPSAGVPYPLLVMAGMLPWQFFAAALSESGNSLVNNTALITK